jgi:FeS assembly SUF system protein
MPKPIDTTESHGGLTSIEKSLLEHEVVEMLRTVYDPEIPVNVYDLGLIYDIRIGDDKHAHIVMTLTSPMCPVAGSLPGEVEVAAGQAQGISGASVELTWDPPYSLELMPEETKLMLGF